MLEELLKNGIEVVNQFPYGAGTCIVITLCMTAKKLMNNGIINIVPDTKDNKKGYVFDE